METGPGAPVDNHGPDSGVEVFLSSHLPTTTRATKAMPTKETAMNRSVHEEWLRRFHLNSVRSTTYPLMAIITSPKIRSLILEPRFFRTKAGLFFHRLLIDGSTLTRAETMSRA
jgi:hypothetical protein